MGLSIEVPGRLERVRQPLCSETDLPRVTPGGYPLHPPAEGAPRRTRPDLDWNVNLKAYLEVCPARTTTRGTFFLHVRDRVRQSLREEPASLCDGMAESTWSPFKSYPHTDFKTLAHRAAILLYPDRPTAEGLRRIGWLSYKSLSSTMAGRILLFSLGDRFEDVLSVGPTAYRITLPASVVRLERRGERRFSCELRNVHSFVDSYHYGVLEGLCLAFELEPTIVVRRLARLCDADFDLSW